MQVLAALISGFVMAQGLIISGMTNTKKVIGFLDVFGDFDPTLMVVMTGALVVTAVGFRCISLSKPLLGASFDIPKKSNIDFPLILGSALFGIGWGLAGLCPGPAFVGFGAGSGKIIVFVITMLVGMYSARKLISASLDKPGNG